MIGVCSMNELDTGPGFASGYAAVDHRTPDTFC